MSTKKPTPISQMFVSATQNQEMLQLLDRVDELEEELRQLRLRQLDSNEKEVLEQQIQELAHQLSRQSGEIFIPINQIYPDPDQPRTVFPKAVVQARAKSLREEGQHSPVILIPQKENRYKLFDGELRWRAAPEAGLVSLRAVLLTQKALEKLDKTAILDHQLTTSLQSEKLHPYDLANGLVKLMVHHHPELAHQIDVIPSLLNAIVQRLRRTGEITELEEIVIADLATQRIWIQKVCTSDLEARILETILNKQLNPVSINSNVIPLLNLSPDLLLAARNHGLEGSKILELKRISGKNLGISEEEATEIRVEVTQEVLRQKLALDKIRVRVKEIIQKYKQPKQKTKQVDVSQRLRSIPKQLSQAKVWEDPQKKKRLEKLLGELEKLLS